MMMLKRRKKRCWSAVSQSDFDKDDDEVEKYDDDVHDDFDDFSPFSDVLNRLIEVEELEQSPSSFKEENFLKVCVHKNVMKVFKEENILKIFVIEMSSP